MVGVGLILDTLVFLLFFLFLSHVSFLAFSKEPLSWFCGRKSDLNSQGFFSMGCGFPRKQVLWR